MSEVRTRFAPSPTGFIHVGGIRTALFAFLVARQSNGKFILRLEDTDQKREVTGADQHIMKSLHALGLNYDEGPDIGGPFGPYRQSERLDTYKKWALKLVEAGRAYADPYAPEEIQAFRNESIANKKPFLYRNHRPENSLVWDGSKPLRFKSQPQDYTWHDAVMGNSHAGAEAIDDFILMKSDGFPTYNFAHIVDDAEMQITHVIRGQEFISSMPNYLNLYEALNLEKPVFATMPHILAESGNKKLSKRDGAKDVLEYLRDGFLVEALDNFIASLGWNDGTEQEIFSMNELITKFSLERVQRSGARFDEKRLIWMNGQWVKQLSLDDLFVRCSDFWGENGRESGPDRQKEILKVVQERLKTLADLPALTEYFFVRPTPDWSMVDENKQLKKLSRTEQIELLKAAETAFENLDDEDFLDEGKTQECLNSLLERTKSKPPILFGMIRYALTWAPFSPGLPETMRLLGRDETLVRIKAAIS
ncbi:glutamate--tRNA ligase [Candidatus Saccharibacteria bacterium]|nr:glutamate--tRNA ligase [Candidatus Saccharibacteria bacterium]